MFCSVYLPLATGGDRAIWGLTGLIPKALLFNCTARLERGVLELLPSEGEG